MEKVRISIAAILITLLMAGSVSAAGTIDITSTAPVDPVTGEMLLDAGFDAFTQHALLAAYNGFDGTGNYYVTVREGSYKPVGTVAWTTGTVSMGGVGTFNVPIHWTPANADIGKTFTVWASGSGLGTFKVAAQVTQPVPELSTGLLMSVGLFGLVGLTRYRRKE